MTHDLMNRLRAANPVVDEPEAPPVELVLARLEPPRRSRRPLALALAALALLAAIVAASELRQPSPDVLAQAQEALGTGQGEIVHTVLRTETREGDGTVRRGMFLEAPTPSELTGRSERWTAANPRRERVRTFIRPRGGGAELWVESDYADGVSRGASSWEDELRVFQMAPPLGPEEPEGPASITGDPLAGIRAMLAKGMLRDDGETVAGERRVRRLVGHEPRRRYEGGVMSPAVDVEYLVDAETFVPVRATFKFQPLFKSQPLAEGGPTPPTDTSTIVFETYERIPLTPETEGLLRIPDADQRRVVEP